MLLLRGAATGPAGRRTNADDSGAVAVTADHGSPGNRNPHAGSHAEVGHPTWKLARYLAAYRGNLSRQEAARRAGLPEVLWDKVETSQPSEPAAEAPVDLLPAAIVAAMCAAVRADVATGLKLAGHHPESYGHLIEQPPVFSPLASRVDAVTGPYIATPHVVAAALAGDADDATASMAAVYRRLAESNGQVADQISAQPPDSRAEYWSGYAAAIRIVAEQQARAAEAGSAHVE